MFWSKKKILPFSRLQRKLSFSYTLAILTAMLLAFSLLIVIESTGSVQGLGNLEEISYSSLSYKATEVLRYLLPTLDVAGLESWLHSSLAQEILLLNDENFPYLVLSPESFTMAVFDSVGQVLIHSEDELALPQQQYYVGQALTTEISGKYLIYKDVAKQEINLFFPILAAKDVPKGVLMMSFPSTTFAFNPFTIFLTSLFYMLDKVVLFIIISLLTGTLVGTFVSRGIVQRLQELSKAAKSWGKGSFTFYVTDNNKDEIAILTKELNNMANELSDLLSTRSELAVLDERNRLARELHDSVKQHTFAINMQLSSIKTLFKQNPEAATETLEESIQLNNHIQQELSRLIHALRPAALEGKGLAKAVQDYTEQWSKQNSIPAEVLIQNECTAGLNIELALYRILQEGLANVVRHARATKVTIHLRFDKQICLMIEDNGQGFDSKHSRQGYGLQSMKERLKSLGGRLVIESDSQAGTSLSIFLPLE